MTLYDSVIANLKGVIGSRRDGVPLSILETEYKSIVGEVFPIRRLGYDSSYDFIKSHQEFFRFEGCGRFCRVMNVIGRADNDTTLDLINLIQNTQPKNKRKREDFIAPVCRNQIGFKPKYHSGYQSNYLTNFDNTIPPIKFTNSYNCNDYFSNSLNGEFKSASDATYYNAKFVGFYRDPITELKSYGINEEGKKSNLIVPRQCLISSKVTADKGNILVISDDNSSLIPRSDLETQTLKKKFNTVKRLCCTFQSLELVNIIIDVIIEFKQIKYDDIIKVKIEGELYFNFGLLTGLSIDPSLFYDYVINSVDSPKIQYIYKGLICLDYSKSYCLFNIKSTYKTRTRLPEYEFDFGKEYIVEVVKVFHDNLIAYKINNKLNPVLDWKKSTTSEQAKEIIESQHFWSWIPGSLCLVQLPYYIVKKLNVSSVERAVIISSDIATLKDEVIKNSQPYLFHNTSFYLIDHEKEVEELLSCCSSFQKVKCKAKERNNTDITFVCNMSICAMNTPSKIQFTKLENFKEVCHTFLDINNQLKPNIMIVLKNIKKITYIFHFQSMYSSSSRAHTICEATHEVLKEMQHYKGDTIFLNQYNEKDTKIDYSDVIVISDDDDEVSVNRNAQSNASKKINTILNQTAAPQKKVDPLFNNSCKNYPSVSSYLDKAIHTPTSADLSILKITESLSSNKINKFVKFGEHIITRTTQPFYSEKIAFKLGLIKANESNLTIDKFNICPLRTLTDNTSGCFNKSVDQRYSSSVDKSCNRINSKVNEDIHLQKCSTVVDTKVDISYNTAKKLMGPVNGVRTTLSYDHKRNNKHISIVSYSESDENEEFLNSNKMNDLNINPLSLSRSDISYSESQLNPPRKCLRPLTIDLINSFNGKVVKLLHIQNGCAVLMLLDSLKLMKQEIKMMTSLTTKSLHKAENISVGDFYIWQKQNDMTEKDNVVLFIEVMQLISQDTVLINNVHKGLLSVVKVKDLFYLPEDKSGDLHGNIQTLIGPTVGAFDLHMFPDWFSPDDQLNYSNELFTAYFMDDGKLVLEYLEEPCRFLNIEIVPLIEKSLAVNHCIVKSAHFIEVLSKNLLQCRLCIGSILEMIHYENSNFDKISITKALRKFTINDSDDVCFASVITIDGEGLSEYFDNNKLSPHNFTEDQFCIDRLIYDERRHSLRLMDYQNIYIDVPKNLEGLYKFDKTEVKGSLKGDEEFYYRYMLAGATGIPDVKYLHDKLIFNAHGF